MSTSVLQASYPSLCTPHILDCGALPLRRREHSFASFREFVKTRDFGCARYCRGAVISGRSERFCSGTCSGTYLALRMPAKLVKNSTLRFIRVCGAGKN
jgi:hypothetical protein